MTPEDIMLNEKPPPWPDDAWYPAPHSSWTGRAWENRKKVLCKDASNEWATTWGACSPRLKVVLALVLEPHVWPYIMHKFRMTGVVDLMTLAVKNAGITPSRLVKTYHLKIGTATRLKAMAAEANADWESFVDTHCLRITNDDDDDSCEDTQGNVWLYAPDCASWHVKNRKRLRDEDEDADDKPKVSRPHGARAHKVDSDDSDAGNDD